MPVHDNWSRSIVFWLHVIEGMINWSGDTIDPCLFLYLFVIVVQVHKRPGEFENVSSLFFPLPHHNPLNQVVMSPPYTSFLFSFKEGASAPNMVEAMEQVGDPASLCLK